MDSYSERLKAYLDAEARQDVFASRINKSQAAVSRYAAGHRFPDAATARVIETESGGAVPFSLWQEEAMRRLGIDGPAQAAA
jgi:hypothetical protein